MKAIRSLVLVSSDPESIRRGAQEVLRRLQREIQVFGLENEVVVSMEPTHGSAPKYAGQYKVNPIATILAARMMLDWLGEAEKAARLEAAVAAVIAEGTVRTYDMGGSATTLDMARAITGKL